MATDVDVDELAGEEERAAAARELRGAARAVAGEAGRELARLFAEWVRTRPLKRLIRRRRARAKSP